MEEVKEDPLRISSKAEKKLGYEGIATKIGRVLTLDSWFC